jgi:hypothetical protein
LRLAHKAFLGEVGDERRVSFDGHSCVKEDFQHINLTVTT